MRKLTIFNYIRDKYNHDRITGTNTLRIINVTGNFVGIGSKGEINRAEFSKLAKDLEPAMEDFHISQ